MVKNFAILGERCSGTNYLEELMLTNFDINITSDYGHKHFFGTYNFKKTETENETLFIGIVRHPMDWLNSFFDKLHHVPKHLHPINNFLTDNFYSVGFDKQDANFITGKKYKNIFELRFVKNNYLMNTMYNNVKNYILINYENLSNNTTNVLNMIQTKFNLTKKFPLYKNILYYKKELNHTFKKTERHFPKKYHLLCIANLNKQQEAALGYTPLKI
jgi:hypothetical protein